MSSGWTAGIPAGTVAPSSRPEEERAGGWRGPSSMAVEELPEPVPGPGTAVVRVERAGICGSDVGAYRGTMGIARPGDVRGHELAGVVTGVGDAGDAGWIGTSVAVD